MNSSKNIGEFLASQRVIAKYDEFRTRFQFRRKDVNMSILFIFPGLMAVDLSIAKALKTFPRLLYIAWHIAIFVLSFLVAWWMGSFIFHLVSSFMPVVAWSAIAISTLVSFILAVLLLMFLALMGIYLLWKINEKYWHIDFAKMIIDER